jgi:autotransporter family porin
MRSRAILPAFAAVALLPAAAKDCDPPPPNPPDHFQTVPVGEPLPSGADCASRVDDAAEVRPANNTYNATPGTDAHDGRPRVDGNFTGSTDEILQWAACKWGIDEDIVRAQAVTESYWFQTAGGDLTNNQADCHPDLRTTSGPCPESIGVLQVRFGPHEDAFEDSNAINSTAYNVDYAYAIWRACFEGEFTWLNDVEHGATYRAGDERGCLGVWFAGRYRTAPALQYMSNVQGHVDARTWETAAFHNAQPPAPYVP